MPISGSAVAQHGPHRIHDVGFRAGDGRKSDELARGGRTAEKDGEDGGGGAVLYVCLKDSGEQRRC